MVARCTKPCYKHPLRVTNGGWRRDHGFTSRMYGNGVRKCRICDEFFMTDSLRCPCCNQIMRGKPRNSAERIKANIDAKRY